MPCQHFQRRQRSVRATKIYKIFHKRKTCAHLMFEEYKTVRQRKRRNENKVFVTTSTGVHAAFGY
jgi:hypothetical protein